MAYRDVFQVHREQEKIVVNQRLVPEQSPAPSQKSVFLTDLRAALLFALLAILLYLPGINWGTPPADAPGRTASWAFDEIGAMGPLVMVRNAVFGGTGGDSKYPLFHFFLVSLFDAPYLLYETLTGGLRHPQSVYPYGFSDPVRDVRALFLIARGVSLLMGAGTVVVAYFTARTMWDRTTARLAGTFVMLLFPMFFYSRTSNVDVPAVFWTSLVLLVFTHVLKEGLSLGRAGALGVFSALAVATKDQYYAVILVLPLVFLPLHARRMREAGITAVREWCQAPLVGLVAASVVYGFASGLFIGPARYFEHLRFVRSGSSAGWYFKYPATLAGFWGLFRECVSYLASSMSWPLLLAAVAGVILCWRYDRLNLGLLTAIPGLFILVLAPVRFVLLRFLIIAAYVLSLYAARAVATGFRSLRQPVRWTAGAVAALGCAWMVVHAADLTYQMVWDPRYAASSWLQEHTRQGDRVDIFAPPRGINNYPKLKAGTTFVSPRVWQSPGNASLGGEFVITLSYSWNLATPIYPAWAEEQVRSGASGYVLVASFQNPSLFTYGELSVNRRVEIFARRDRARELGFGAAGG